MSEMGDSGGGGEATQVSGGAEVSGEQDAGAESTAEASSGSGAEASDGEAGESGPADAARGGPEAAVGQPEGGGAADESGTDVGDTATGAESAAETSDESGASGTEPGENGPAATSSDEGPGHADAEPDSGTVGEGDGDEIAADAAETETEPGDRGPGQSDGVESSAEASGESEAGAPGGEPGENGPAETGPDEVSGDADTQPEDNDAADDTQDDAEPLDDSEGTDREGDADDADGADDAEASADKAGESGPPLTAEVNGTANASSDIVTEARLAAKSAGVSRAGSPADEPGDSGPTDAGSGEVLPDGRETVVIGDVKAFSDLCHRQGENPFGFQGTCGLCSCEGVLRQFGTEVTETHVVAHAITHGQCSLEGDAEMRGATRVEQQVQILSDFGLTAHYETDGSLEDLADALKEGRGVIAEVDAGVLWDDPNNEDGRSFNHAITPIGVALHPQTGEIQGFYVNDTGTGEAGKFVDAATMAEAWEQRGGVYIVTDRVHMRSEQRTAS